MKILLYIELPENQMRNAGKEKDFFGSSTGSAINRNTLRLKIPAGLSSKKVSPGEIFFDFSLRSPGDEWEQSRFGLSPFVFTAIRLRNGL